MNILVFADGAISKFAYEEHNMIACETKCYKSQIKEYPNPRSSEGIRALAMYRGSTVGIEYAECFMTVRNIII